jgi:NAD(P)-dependent dehydrogenase (short-subunit alcohol dehydrogenase family)
MVQKTIFITGCSSGIGYDAAIVLQARGYRVIASCRRLADVERLQQLGLDTIQLDVNDEASIATAVTTLLKKTNGRLDVLINNAGYGQAGALEDVPRSALIAQFNTNVFGLMELTRLVIPVMRAQGFGRIINMSSVLGFISMPFRGAYNASKYAVEGLSDTLRLELKPAGINVITIEPGPIESRFREHAVEDSMQSIDIEHSHFKWQYRHMLSKFKAAKHQSRLTKKTDAVIHKLVRAIESKSPKPKYLVTLPTYVFMILKRVLSIRLLDKCLSIVSKSEMKNSIDES